MDVDLDHELARQLTEQGVQGSAELVRRLLRQKGCSVQPREAGRRCLHPYRNAQFEYLDEVVAARLAADEPVLSVDTKKKGSPDSRVGGVAG